MISIANISRTVANIWYCDLALTLLTAADYCHSRWSLSLQVLGRESNSNSYTPACRHYKQLHCYSKPIANATLVHQSLASSNCLLLPSYTTQHTGLVRWRLSSLGWRCWWGKRDNWEGWGWRFVMGKGKGRARARWAHPRPLGWWSVVSCERRNSNNKHGDEPHYVVPCRGGVS